MALLTYAESQAIIKDEYNMKFRMFLTGFILCIIVVVYIIYKYYKPPTDVDDFIQLTEKEKKDICYNYTNDIKIGSKLAYNRCINDFGKYYKST